MSDPTRALWTKTRKANKVEKSEAEWQAQLTPEQFHVARKAGTERAFTGPNWDQKAAGVYKCICCGQALFDADTKYDSGTGWPSFYAPVAEDAVEYVADKSLFSTRTEVVCSNCDGHLGHVFPDGPAPTGLRYCMNGLAMDFDRKED